MQGRVDTLERSNIDLENQKAVMAANLQAAVQEKDSLRDALKEKDHTLDLLSMDKVGLTTLRITTQSFVHLPVLEKINSLDDSSHLCVRQVLITELKLLFLFRFQTLLGLVVGRYT